MQSNNHKLPCKLIVPNAFYRLAALIKTALWAPVLHITTSIASIYMHMTKNSS